jgi:hypothetical protein
MIILRECITEGDVTARRYYRNGKMLSKEQYDLDLALLQGLHPSVKANSGFSTYGKKISWAFPATA